MFQTVLLGTMKISHRELANSVLRDVMTASIQRLAFSVLQDFSSGLTVSAILLVKSDSDRTLQALPVKLVQMGVLLVQRW